MSAMSLYMPILLMSFCSSTQVYLHPGAPLKWEEGTWTQPLPPMPTPRTGASAVSTQHYLIVAGGVGYSCEVFTTLDVVEVYNGKQWVRTAAPLPKCCSRMKSTLHDGFLYLMGGQCQGNSVLQCSVQELIEQATPHPPKQSTWNTIRDAHYVNCSVATFGGALVAVGGFDKDTTTPFTCTTPSPSRGCMLGRCLWQLPALVPSHSPVVR